MSPSMRSAGPTTPMSRLLKRTEETRTFTFDRIFDEKATQTQVFDHVKPLVDAVVDGYNSTIFTYGYFPFLLFIIFISLFSSGVFIHALQTNWIGQDLHDVRLRVRIP